MVPATIITWVYKMRTHAHQRAAECDSAILVSCHEFAPLQAYSSVEDSGNENTILPQYTTDSVGLGATVLLIVERDGELPPANRDLPLAHIPKATI
jgi:hypothetical protein